MPLPFNRHVYRARSSVDELSHAVLLAGRYHVIIRAWLLQHQPLHLDVIACVSPLPQGIESPEIQMLLKPELDARERASDLASHEGLPAKRGLVIEENAIAGINTVCLAVVHGNPMRVKLCRGIRTARVKRRRLPLWHLCGHPVQFGRRGLVEPCLFLQAENADG